MLLREVLNMKVVLKQTNTSDGRVISSLTLGNTYEVIGIEGNEYRIVDDNREPLLFDPICFDVVDNSEPSFWVSAVEDGVRYAYPPEWARTGFFEDYFDYRDETRWEFWSQFQRYFGGEGREHKRGT
jgi:hypothetical protein